jgi:putative phage-type endonuclease
MALTATQRAARAEGIGASEIGAILGVDPFKNAYAVWAEKTGKVAPEAENDAMRRGNRLEPLILSWAEEELNQKIVRPTGTYKHTNGIMFANLDAQILAPKRGQDVVEAKSSGIPDGWGEPGSDQIPERVLAQVTGQMMCSDATTAYVARLSWTTFAGPKLDIYPITFDDSLAALIEDACLAFWENHVEKDIPPADVPPDLETVKRFLPRKGERRAVRAEVAKAFMDARRVRLDAEKAEEAAQAMLLAELQGAEFGECPGIEIKYPIGTQNRIDLDRLREEAPDIAAKFTKATPTRRLTVAVAKVK